MPEKPKAVIIFLTGMPAAGKTYWGSKLAEKYHLPFIDLDLYIAKQEAASISAMFAKYGENGFREREHKYLKKIIHQASSDTIIACGGGTPCNNDNMRLMKEAGIVIYLQADITYLLRNLAESTEIRPLLNNRGDLSVHLAEMLKKREKFYEQANYILPAKDTSLITFDEIILSCINRH